MTTGAVIIIAHATDASVVPVASLLKDRLGPEKVRIIRPEILSLARWSHHIDRNGRAITRVRWPRSRDLPGLDELDDSAVGAVLNRIRCLSVVRFRRANAKDRDYAYAEMQALILGWLEGYGHRAVQPVGRNPWVTPMLPRQHWTSAAAAVGLPVLPQLLVNSPHAQRWASGSCSHGRLGPGLEHCTETVLVAGSRTCGPLAREFGPRCLQVSRNLDLPLLEFQFVMDREVAMVSDINPLPSLDRPIDVELTAGYLESLAKARLTR